MALACTATERHTFNIDTDTSQSQEIQATIVLARVVGGTPWTGLIGVATNISEPSRDAIVTGQAPYVAFYEQHAVGHADHPHLINPLGRLPCDRGS